VLYPEPTPGDVPINEPTGAEVAVGERVTFTFEQKNRVSELIIPIVAASKYAGCVYEIRADGRSRYGPAPIPPTDIDDLQVTFLPALRFEDRLTIEVTNLGSVAREINAQPIGWEPSEGGE
jgi:hypothetical protein